MNPTVSAGRRLAVVAAVVALVAGVIVAVMALDRARDAFVAQHARPLAVGDCVAVDSAVAGAESVEVEARRAACSADPSYTVGALATSAGDCPSDEYQHFPGPAADRVTASLCLVPNLVADHCYRLGVPIGLVERADCAAPSGDLDSGLLVQITRRLEVRDQHACPSVNGQYAWPYPSPARTYCTVTVF
ncbi:hypothetical protein [[Mycobacterium] burgundiense]|jgi:hypothetical protein|uniref:Uncharacterized protein n=1 Tax=[Mycobacterium] burgundiense TaxID=3064286 RepID=A0ABN9NQF3_9MYCO|nr:hypothetical protein [Mycolicibacterium sp. MU0053]CAJ1510368.1 hypothetical protein MU0053_004576 [Mycolicibacterium sp. MU0053]